MLVFMTKNPFQKLTQKWANELISYLIGLIIQIGVSLLGGTFHFQVQMDCPIWISTQMQLRPSQPFNFHISFFVLWKMCLSTLRLYCCSLRFLLSPVSVTISTVIISKHRLLFIRVMFVVVTCRIPEYLVQKQTCKFDLTGLLIIRQNLTLPSQMFCKLGPARLLCRLSRHLFTA